jgi:hypothetical protein
LHLKKKPKNDDEPLGSLSSFTPKIKNKKMTASLMLQRLFYTWKKNKKMMMSHEVHRHLLHLRKKPRDAHRIPYFLLAFFSRWRKPNKCRLLWLYCGVPTTT